SNAPAQWNVSFGQQSGDVILYLRDTVPPGLGADGATFRDWASDQKNHGPYPNYDAAGSYALTEPALRPGHTYYLGFRAVNDANFSVNSSATGVVFAGTNTIAFYGGAVTHLITPNGSILYRTDVPSDA